MTMSDNSVFTNVSGILIATEIYNRTNAHFLSTFQLSQSQNNRIE